MKILIPFVNDPEFIEDSTIEFYQGVAIPTVQGGREPVAVGRITPFLAETKKLIEKYGKRYAVLATSTVPEWSEDFDELCACLNRNRGVLVVADVRFAAEVRDAYPSIELQASTILGLFEPFSKLLQSPLFTVVGLPNLWHHSYEMINRVVPKSERHRVNVIVSKYCIWRRQCKDHYNMISKWHKLGITDLYKCTRPAGTYRTDKISAGPLYEAGFERFKLAGRGALNLDYQNGVRILKERIAEIKAAVNAVVKPVNA